MSKKKIGVSLIPNLFKEDTGQPFKEIADYLQKLGVDIFVAKQYAEHFLGNGSVTVEDTEEKAVEKSNVVIATGGDGTIIRAAKKAAFKKKPILGINFGRLGFTSGLEKDEIFKLKGLISDEYKVQTRAILLIKIIKGKETRKFYALNDAVISRGELSRTIDLEIFLQNTEVCNYRADGVILATPTGSTGYSLSAGGPIVDPEMRCIIMTPICSHSMFARPSVFNEETKLKLKVSARECVGAFLTIDGEKIIDIENSDFVEVSISDYSVEMITFDERCFYKKIDEKLSRRKL